MTEKDMATSMNRGQKKTRFDAYQNRFTSQNYTSNPRASQCTFCQSDYMNFAVNGCCQRCQQRCEYVVRERSGKRGRAV